MRFRLGPIPEEFEPDDSWRPLREPGEIVMQIFATPLGLGAAAAVAWAWHNAGVPLSIHFAPGDVWLPAAIILSFPLLIFVHELLHAVVYPDGGCSPQTTIGAWPSRLMFFAHYAGALRRERFLVVLAMPPLVITVLPLAAAYLGLLPTAAYGAAAWFSTWNAFFACGDYFGMLLITWQVPRGAIVRNRGWRTFWKPVGSITNPYSSEPDQSRQHWKSFSEHYGDSKDYRIIVYERLNGTFGYRFETKHTLDVFGMPFPDGSSHWTQDYPQAKSGVYQSAERALKEAEGELGRSPSEKSA
jgi:hypothetical protein